MSRNIILYINLSYRDCSEIGFAGGSQRRRGKTASRVKLISVDLVAIFKSLSSNALATRDADAMVIILVGRLGGTEFLELQNHIITDTEQEMLRGYAPTCNSSSNNNTSSSSNDVRWSDRYRFLRYIDNKTGRRSIITD